MSGRDVSPERQEWIRRQAAGMRAAWAKNHDQWVANIQAGRRARAAALQAGRQEERKRFAYLWPRWRQAPGGLRVIVAGWRPWEKQHPPWDFETLAKLAGPAKLATVAKDSGASLATLDRLARRTGLPARRPRKPKPGSPGV